MNAVAKLQAEGFAADVEACSNPGVYWRLPRAVYNAIPAVNQSTLKDFAKNPQAWQDGRPSRSSDFFVWGSLFETLLFDDEWQRDFAVLDFSIKAALLDKAQNRQREKKQKPSPKFSKSITEFKEWERLQIERGRTVIDEELLAEADLAVRRARREPNIAGLLELGGECQVCVVWIDSDTGVLCKALIDFVPNGLASLVDVKTTREIVDASRTEAPYKFARACRKLGYGLQASFYCDGWNAVMANDPRHTWLFVVSGNAQPWPAAAWRLSPEEMEHGRHQYKDALYQWKAAHESGHFPGLTTEDEWPELPTPFER